MLGISPKIDWLPWGKGAQQSQKVWVFTKPLSSFPPQDGIPSHSESRDRNLGMQRNLIAPSYVPSEAESVLPWSQIARYNDWVLPGSMRHLQYEGSVVILDKYLPTYDLLFKRFVIWLIILWAPDDKEFLHNLPDGSPHTATGERSLPQVSLLKLLPNPSWVLLVGLDHREVSGKL